MGLQVKALLIGMVLLVVGCGTADKENTPLPVAEKALDPNASNPIIPGYFADPTIKKFGDVYYIYATTDNEMLASGAPTVWYSKDLEHWYNYTMEIPSLNSVSLRNYWAPDIIEGKDGKYYLYFGNCQDGCNIYGYVSETPVGPWEKLNDDDTPVIAHHYPNEGFPSLDAQFFTDTDGKIYGYWGTWVHYNGGYAVAELDAETMKDMSHPKKIPLDQTPEPFEAAYMMKKGDTYILMYSGGSCHDETYNVRYAYASSPYGPFTPGKNNPILSSTDSGGVHGPGHHSVLQEGDKNYIVYHKHDYPMTRGGMSRQVCLDKLIFENDSTIKKVSPSYERINFDKDAGVPSDLAFGAKTSASSEYHVENLEYRYKSEYATDHNNATMWKAATTNFPQSLTIDLGASTNIKRIATQFEFASYYYQYKLEYSTDGVSWSLYADRTDNRVAGSPMLDDYTVEAQYIKLTVVGTEKEGLLAAVWNIEVYADVFELPLDLINIPSAKEPAIPSTHSKMVSVSAADISSLDSGVPNTGSLGGMFKNEDDVWLTEDKESGKKVFQFKEGSLVLDKPAPTHLAWNAPFSIATWVKNPEINTTDEFLFSWCNRETFGLANSYNALTFNSGSYGAMAHLDGHFDMKYQDLPEANRWHFIVVTFDGVVEKVYVDGVLNNQQIMLLSSAVDDAKMIIGASDVGEHYTGYLYTLEMYDYAIDQATIKELQTATSPLRP